MNLLKLQCVSNKAGLMRIVTRLVTDDALLQFVPSTAGLTAGRQLRSSASSIANNGQL